MSALTHTIVTKGKGHHEEANASGAILPGQAVELEAAGTVAQQVAAQADALKAGLKIAKEDALQGKTTADAYAASDVCFIYIPLSGDHVQVLVKTGEDIAVADKLVVEGGGSGLFVEGAAQAKFQLEALESSGGALAADTLILCRVL